MSADQVIAIAMAQVGKPYIFGHKGPNSFDCSGLVVYAFKHGAGIDLPHFTGSLWNRGSKVTRAQLQPGDLVFPDLGHVQIYIGNGKVVEAPQPGSKVKVSNIWGFFGARRIISPGKPVDGSSGGTGGSVIPIGNPVDSVSALVEAFRNIDAALKWITDAKNWRRIGFFIVGFSLMLFAVIRWNGAKAVVTETAKVAKKVSK